MRGELSSGACLEDPAAARLELPATDRPGAGARRESHPALEEGALAGVKKKAKNQGRIIVFIDESGLSERPHRCRTWAPRDTPRCCNTTSTGKLYRQWQG